MASALTAAAVLPAPAPPAQAASQARQLQAELDAIQAAQPPAQDISLLDELPWPMIPAPTTTPRMET